jgi:hypothetical protein
MSCGGCVSMDGRTVIVTDSKRLSSDEWLLLCEAGRRLHAGLS